MSHLVSFPDDNLVRSYTLNFLSCILQEFDLNAELGVNRVCLSCLDLFDLASHNGFGLSDTSGNLDMDPNFRACAPPPFLFF